METVPNTSSWVPGIGSLAGNRSCLEVTSFLARMFSGNMVARAAADGAEAGWGQSYAVTSTVRTVGLLLQEVTQPSVP